jgi:ubiquinone/menaquinone biosynthesis C-methylase UbiE
MNNNIIDYYNKIAKIYDEDRFGNTYGQFIDQQERKTLDKLIPKNNAITLDLACGSGRLLNYAHFGADASIEMIQLANAKYPEKTLTVADAEQLPYADNSIDTILSFHFFMHLDEAKIAKILKECARVLKPNGRMIFDIPSYKRRSLFEVKSDNWHGSFSCKVEDLETMTDAFKLKSTHGLLFFPIHRFPKKLRLHLLNLDYFFANSFLKVYSSYIVVVLEKSDV